MKAILAALIVLFLTGCTSKTEFGDCIGAFDEKKPNLTYKLNGTNLAVGVVLVEMIIPPIVVVVDETFCPIGVK